MTDERKLPLHRANALEGWVVTLAVPDTKAGHADTMLRALGDVVSTVVPPGRVGANRTIRNTLGRYGIAVTVRADDEELEGTDADVARLVADIGSVVDQYRKSGKLYAPLVADLLAEAQMRLAEGLK